MQYDIKFLIFLIVLIFQMWMQNVKKGEYTNKDNL